MTHINLDEQFISTLTPDAVKRVFKNIVERKTDLLDGNISIAKGSDGIDYQTFDKNINKHAQIICSKGSCGKYIFSPFREVAVPKPPFERDQLEQAKKVGKVRTLSVSTIQDTIFQELISQVIVPYVESIFSTTVDMHSFAYRKGKSSKKAVELIIKYMNQGYKQILDGDIEKFFDRIDHTLLFSKVGRLLGYDNKIINRYIYRFMNVRRIADGKYPEYRSGKYEAEKRLIGIPQGGVLSGLLANVFLLDFDRYIVNEILEKYDCKYIRYADDFVVMFKTQDHILEVFEKLRDYLSNENLKLHDIGNKSKILDLSKTGRDELEFLGFAISPKYLRVKESNVTKFLHRIEKVIRDIPADDSQRYLDEVTLRIRPKIIGMEDLLSENGYCPACGQLLQKRNWIGYFMMIDDVRLLRNMDTSIRTIIYKDFHRKSKRHMRKKEMLTVKNRLLSLEQTFYSYKKQIRRIETGKSTYCKCFRYYDYDTKTIVVVPTSK